MVSVTSRSGQAFLSLVLLMGGTMLLIGLTLVFITVSFVDTGYGYQAISQAEAMATSGAEDALLQLERNNSTFGSSGGESYTLPVGSGYANVTVTTNAPSAGFVTILSTASVANHTRNVTIVAAVNATTSQVSIASWQVTQ